MLATETDASKGHVRDLMRERGCPMIAMLKENYQVLRTGFVSTDELVEELSVFNEGGGKVAGKVVAEKLHKAFGAAPRQKRLRRQGERISGWAGITRAEGGFAA